MLGRRKLLLCTSHSECSIRNTDQGLTSTCPKAKLLKEHRYGALFKIASGIYSAFETRGLGSACLEHHQEVQEAQGRAPLLPHLPSFLPLSLLHSLWLEHKDWSRCHCRPWRMKWTEKEVGGDTWLHCKV